MALSDVAARPRRRVCRPFPPAKSDSCRVTLWHMTKRHGTHTAKSGRGGGVKQPRQSQEITDPHAQREALKYDNPIASRELITQVIATSGRPLTWRQVAEQLEYDDEERQDALRRRLKAMERDGQLVRNRRDAFLAVDQTDLIRGRVAAHPDGFGFVVPDDGGTDLFLSAREMRRLLHGDRVVVQVAGIDRRGRREGALVEILERANDSIVGRLYFEGGFYFVRPNNKRLHQDVLVPGECLEGANLSDIVRVAIHEPPNLHHPPIGTVVECLGPADAPGMEVDIAVRAFNIPDEWPADVAAEVHHFDREVAEADKAGRVDLRALPFVTIDGEDAKDFDDAVYAEVKDNGFRLMVAIADVAHYVRPGSTLDQEALRRGTSAYFPGRVVPMLPEVLSNGLCSLNPAVDRLCMVCELRINEAGQITRSRFFRGVIHSHARLTYTQVAAALAGEPLEVDGDSAEIMKRLQALHALYAVFAKARNERGALDFDTVETRIDFGEDGRIAQVVPVERNDAHRLIEECMISANVAAARFLKRHKMPALYRVHEGPDKQKFEDLSTFLGEQGLPLPKGRKPKPTDYSVILEKVKERPDRHLIQTMLLRSLTQAVYHPKNNGHFGLALAAYAHFTSPIRRYPDLLVHRGIGHVLDGGTEESFRYSEEDMLAFGDHCSMCERRADEATRDVTHWLKCEYMADKVGEVFPGIVSGVTSFGLFVELAGVYIEGLVHITALEDDHYHFDPVSLHLSGERTGRVFRLGDALRVQVARVSSDERKIDLVPAEESPARETPNKRRRSGRRRTRKG